MLRRTVSILLMFELLSLCCVLVGNAAEHLQWNELPAAVKATIQRRYPQGKMEIAYPVGDDDVEAFRIHLKNKNQIISIDVTENGTVRKISINIPAADLPKSIRLILQEKHPKSNVTLASELYTVREGKDVLTSYFVDLNTRSDERRFMTFEPNGKLTTDYVDTTEFVAPSAPSASPKQPK